MRSLIRVSVVLFTVSPIFSRKNVFLHFQKHDLEVIEVILFSQIFTLVVSMILKICVLRKTICACFTRAINVLMDNLYGLTDVMS